MEKTTVVLNINQQQRPVVDRLLATGRYGGTPAEVVRYGLREFCRLNGISSSTDAGPGGTS